MLRRQDHDSIPRYESFWDDVLRQWREAGHDQNPLDYLGADFCHISWTEPLPFPGQNRLISEDAETRLIENAWGEKARYWKNRMGTPEHHGFPCEEREQWFDGMRQRIIDAPLNQNIDEIKDRFAVARRKGQWACFCGLETFEITRHLMGDETTMIAMLDDPEWVADVSRVTTDASLRQFQQIIDSGVTPDGIWVYGDMAYRSGLLCGPPLYRELIWPDHKRMADFAHERGMPFIYHTDGDVNLVMDDYVRAGFDCFQPMEAKAGMDLTKLAPKYGDKMSFFGNCDVMVYATNDKDLIEEEVTKKVKAGMSIKGYAYHSDHSVPPGTTWETFAFICDLLDRIGNYD